jgi:hypothetical protein
VSRTWPCVYCTHVSLTEAESKRHRNGHPRADRVLTCGICGRVFGSGYGGAYTRHIQAHANAEANFWRNVVQDDETGCWEWQASKIWAGYPRFTVCHKHILAYRFAYELLEGSVPEGLELDHLCRNPGCVNPGHLEPVTRRENMDRALAVRKREPCDVCGYLALGPVGLATHKRFKHKAVA